MNRALFLEWKQHPVTKAVFEQIYSNIMTLQETLAQEAGINPHEDRHKVGYIQACKDLLNIDFEGEQE